MILWPALWNVKISWNARISLKLSRFKLTTCLRFKSKTELSRRFLTPWLKSTILNLCGSSTKKNWFFLAISKKLTKNCSILITKPWSYLSLMKTQDLSTLFPLTAAPKNSSTWSTPTTHKTTSRILRKYSIALKTKEGRKHKILQKGQWKNMNPTRNTSHPGGLAKLQRKIKRKTARKANHYQ